MKYRYLKITGSSIIWGKNNLEKKDLIDVANFSIDQLIDVEESKYFDATVNAWKEIEGVDIQ
jgi:hypothetical protein